MRLFFLVDTKYDNPHVVFDTYHVYLNLSIGPLNINCDPNLSAFNTIVLHNYSSSPQHYRIKVDEKEQMLSFDHPNGHKYFEQLYSFVNGNN
ncbi:hypothetical protein I4U23_023507 [Adineta vaga]|nr:hypothetical protein I4U23_023507 [Adineta vaga]